MEHTCLRCHKTWEAIKDGRPVACPGCHSPYWDKETVRETRREKELKDRIKILETLLAQKANN